MDFKMYCTLFLLSCFVGHVLTDDDDVESIVRSQVEAAMRIKDPQDRENTVVNLVLSEKQKFIIAIRKVGTLKTEIKEAMKHKDINVVRARVEYLERRVFPKGIPNPISRRDRWVTICNSPHPEAQQIRDHVLSEFGSDEPDDSIAAFAESLQRIYGDLSAGNEYALHNQVDEEVLTKLRGNEKEARKLLSVLGVQTDDDNLRALKVISQPLTRPKTKGVLAGSKPLDLNKYRRVDIYPVLPGQTFKNIAKQDVTKFFTVSEIPKNLKIEEAVISIDFDDYTSAVNALNNHRGDFLKGVRVNLKLNYMSDED